MAPSRTVINDRLKNGQCIHCGIQTHKIVKKMFGKNEKIPLHIPGTVEHGRCMLASCQQAGNNVGPDDGSGSSNGKKPNRISGQAVGVAASVGGAVMTGLGLPGGELLSSAGQAIADSSPSSSSQQQPFGLGDFSNSSTSSYMDNYQKIIEQQNQQVQQYLQQAQAHNQQQQQAVSDSSPSFQHQQFGFGDFWNSSTASYLDNYQKIIEQQNQQAQQYLQQALGQLGQAPMAVPFTGQNAARGGDLSPKKCPSSTSAARPKVYS